MLKMSDNDWGNGDYEHGSKAKRRGRKTRGRTIKARSESGDRSGHGGRGYRSYKPMLYTRQSGVCNGCERGYHYRVMQVDHIVAKARGGSDHPANLQLLCKRCNQIKSTRSQALFLKILFRRGIRRSADVSEG